MLLHLDVFLFNLKATKQWSSPFPVKRKKRNRINK